MEHHQGKFHRAQQIYSASNNHSRILPSRKLLDHVSSIVENKPIFSLLNEQLVAKNLIMSKVRKAARAKTKNVVIVQGGPGTGGPGGHRGRVQALPWLSS